jgi:hypothetical protein
MDGDQQARLNATPFHPRAGGKGQWFGFANLTARLPLPKVRVSGRPLMRKQFS